LPEDYYNIKMREADNKNQPLFFDNPKTNLIYEKTLCVILFKYHAKSSTKIFITFGIKKYLNLKH